MGFIVRVAELEAILPPFVEACRAARRREATPAELDAIATVRADLLRFLHRLREIGAGPIRVAPLEIRTARDLVQLAIDPRVPVEMIDRLLGTLVELDEDAAPIAVLAPAGLS